MKVITIIRNHSGDYLVSTDQDLIEAARRAKQMAYAPYSGFRVGAALLTPDGTIIEGCNVESITLTPTVCAERNSIFAAIAKGHRSFQAIAIVTDDKQPTAPCGVCRQVISEFVGDDFRVIMVTEQGSILEKPFSEIFPMRFNPSTNIGKSSESDA